MSIHDYLSLDETVMAALYDGPSKFDGWGVAVDGIDVYGIIKLWNEEISHSCCDG